MAWVFIGEKVEESMDSCPICVCFGLFGEREIKGYSKMWVIGATAQILFLCIIFWIMLVIVHMRDHCLCWILSIGWALSKRKEYSISLFILSLYDIPLYISYILCALFLKRFLLIYIFCLLIKKLINTTLKTKSPFDSDFKKRFQYFNIWNFLSFKCYKD